MVCGVKKCAKLKESMSVVVEARHWHETYYFLKKRVERVENRINLSCKKIEL